MTVSRIRWTQHAGRKLAEAAQYLDQQNAGVGLEFIGAVESALDRAAQFPFANPRVPGEPVNMRKAVLTRYGFWTIYEVQDDRIVVLTVWHAVQEPGSWREANEG